MSILDDVRFWAMVNEEQRRTLICPPGFGARLRALAAQHGAESTVDIEESELCPPGEILIFDVNTIEASHRQALQRAAKWWLA